MLLVFSMFVLAEETDVDLEGGSSSSSSSSGGGDTTPLTINITFPENDSVVSKDMLSEIVVSTNTPFWQVGTSLKKLEMANSNAAANSISGENLYDISTFISKDQLKTLADGTFLSTKGDHDYRQYLYFDSNDVNTNEIVKFAEDDNDQLGDFLYFKNGKNIGKYMLEFTSPAESRIYDTSGSASTDGSVLWDFEGAKITMLGQEYTIVSATRPQVKPEDSVKLILMKGAVKGTLNEGKADTYR